MYIYINYYYCNVNSITIDIYFINMLIYYVSSIMYYINIVIDYNKQYIFIIILIIYNFTETEHIMYPLKHSLGTALSTSLRSVYINFTYMIGLTKRSHVAPKMQHATFCNIIVRFFLCRTKSIDLICGVTWILLCARDGSVIAWGRGEGEILSIHVVSTQCASGLYTFY